MLGKTLAICLKTFRPLLGPGVCKFYPSCTVYACEQLEQENLFVAFKNIFKRIISCF